MQNNHLFPADLQHQDCLKVSFLCQGPSSMHLELCKVPSDWLSIRSLLLNIVDNNFVLSTITAFKEFKSFFLSLARPGFCLALCVHFPIFHCFFRRFGWSFETSSKPHLKRYKTGQFLLAIFPCLL